MRRRVFVTGAGALGAGLLSACASGRSRNSAAGRGQRVIWRLASSFPRALDTIYGTSEFLAEQVDKMSGGRFQIRPYPAGELVPGLQVMDAVQQGTVQLGHTAGYYYKGKHPAFAFETSVPFGLTARQQQAWLSEAGGDEVLAPLFAEFNIVRFIGGNTGAQMGGWFNREINSLADLKGLKIRIPGLGGEVMNRMGATVQVLAGGDIYPAMERGAIDATEWIGPYDDAKLGFQQVSKYYYYPGFWEPGPALSFYANKDALAKLPEEYRAMLEVAMASASARMTAQYDARNPVALAQLRKDGVQFRAFPRDVLTESQKVSEALMDENSAKDPAYRKVCDHFRNFRKQSFDWFALAEQHYANFAFGAESSQPSVRLEADQGGKEAQQK